MAQRFPWKRTAASHQKEADGWRPNDDRGPAQPGKEDQLLVPPLQQIRQTQIERTLPTMTLQSV